MGWIEDKRHQRARRALERQLLHQTEKAERLGAMTESLHSLFTRAQLVRKKLDAVKPVTDEDRILEVGSGPHGLVFGFTNKVRVGVDPLAAEYKRIFPKWQENAATASAIGEELPFADETFDVVISDNVIDHAERPFAIVDELIRVLRPGGLLFFTVNVHHPFYNLASRAYGAWNAAGLKLELSAFADHTSHLTETMVRDVIAHQPLKIHSQSSTVVETARAQRKARRMDPDGLLKKVFFKNALYELIATKQIG